MAKNANHDRIAPSDWRYWCGSYPLLAYASDLLLEVLDVSARVEPRVPTRLSLERESSLGAGPFDALAGGSTALGARLDHASAGQYFERISGRAGVATLAILAVSALNRTREELNVIGGWARPSGIGASSAKSVGITSNVLGLVGARGINRQ